MIEYLDVACPKCGGDGYLDDEIESPCDLCCSEGLVSQETKDFFTNQPGEPVEYWWTNNGRMAKVDTWDE